MDYQKPKGTADLLPGTTGLWEKVEANAREVFRQFGYRGIRTPMFEDYRVFARNVGDTSDIVEKEMYDFHDKGDRHIALRPVEGKVDLDDSSILRALRRIIHSNE